MLTAAGEVMNWPPSPAHAVGVAPGAMVAVHSEPDGPRLNAQTRPSLAPAIAGDANMVPPYGLAVGINPFENPEVQDGNADPTAAAAGWIGHARARR